MNAIEAAEADYKEAALQLMAVIAEQYPIGARVEVTLGGHDLILEVAGHAAAWWHRPGEVFGVNLKTGKQRVFTHRDVRA